MNEVSFFKDENLSYIFNYKFIPFTENCKDSGFIIRIIELYRLAQMKDKIKEFTELTGFQFDNLIPTVEEIKSLIKRGRNFVSSHSKHAENMEKELKSLVDILNKAQNGKISKPDGYYLSTRVWISDMLDSVEIKKDSVRREKDRFCKINGLYGLLYPVIEWLLSEKITGFKKELLESIPRETVYLNSLLSNMNWQYDHPCKLIISEMDKLGHCLNDVINKCTVTTRKHTLFHNPVCKNDYYKTYYSKENFHLKCILTADEYVDAMSNTKKRIQDKLNFM
ncbi:hypothetical protein [Xenorhabdus anantnagensis]|uniref:Uncharacterized protein n=1 Tax=Xenorhabdus anantnagensis TaxID=3025875 RepID=A0ABT5LR06_9GAMM|nr:hypothetical protein [Xenorhabdus anantnagensis]MDC9596857.1 hypothetical protein [Xenorhabdus anantnagensis]